MSRCLYLQRPQGRAVIGSTDHATVREYIRANFEELEIFIPFNVVTIRYGKFILIVHSLERVQVNSLCRN